jgi:O-antigen/teichoic acid export membrane protein
MAGRRLIGNALWNLTPYAWGFLLNVLAIRLIVGRIGVDAFGLFGLLTAVLAPLTLANLGFGEATVKFVAAALHRGDLDEAGRYVRTTLAQNLMVGLGGAVLLAGVGPLVVGPLFHLDATATESARVILAWVALGWIGTQVTAVFLGVPSAAQRYRVVALGIALAQTFVVGAGVAGAFLGGVGGYAAGTALGTLAGAGSWWLIARRILPGVSLRPRVDPETWRSTFGFGGWQALANLGTLLSGQAERFLLGIYLTPAAVGYYNISQTLEQRVYSAVYALSQVLFPHFATLEGAPPERKADLLLRASWLLTALAVCALTPLVSLAHPLLEAWISLEAADAAAPAMQALAVAGILGCASNASFFFLLGVGRTRALALLSGVTGIVTVVAAAVVLRRYGLPAAGVAAVAAMVAQQAMLALVVLPGALGDAIRPARLTLALYVPVLAGLGVAGLVAMAGIGIRGWGGVIVGYGAIAGLCAVAIALAAVLLPGRAERMRDLATLASFVGLRPRGT